MSIFKRLQDTAGAGPVVGEAMQCKLANVAEEAELFA